MRFQWNLKENFTEIFGPGVTPEMSVYRRSTIQLETKNPGTWARVLLHNSKILKDQ